MKKYNSIFIVGPTATGKTALSVALAKALNGEIINADSTQVYKELNIGTAKATEEEMQGIRHHLINIKQPTEDFSVSEFKEFCLEVCEQLLNKNKTPIIVGGTGLYINSLTNNYNYANIEKNLEIREKYETMAREKGNDFVFKILESYDKESANKLHPNDLKRVIRAIEIYEQTGKTKAQIIKEQSTMQSAVQNAENNLLKPLIIGLNMSRETLYARINKRTDIMIENGLVEEVRDLFNRGLSEDLQSIKSIGYKELYNYFKGFKTLKECVEDIKQNTRNYAKRQLTWFNKQYNINWFDVEQLEHNEVLQSVLDLYNKK